MNFLIGFLAGVVAQILTFVQLQGQFKYEWFKEHPFLVSCLGLPLSYIYLISVKYLVASFDGNLWPSRLLGFAIGAVVFAIMSSYWFKEPFSLKTAICLGLALCIILVQVFWK